ncbi:hypothetical protein K2X89_16460, partial [Myxococcota bacterium]|nr:hypothetical protein [Myxococcota bacterium]
MSSDETGSGLPWVDAIARAFEPIAFVDFHRHRLPASIERHGHLVAADLRTAAPLGFVVDDSTAFTWAPAPEGMRILEGDAKAETLVALSERTFSEFIHELLTANGAARTGRAKILRGSVAGWQRWEPAIQSLCSGRPIYGPGVWETLKDRAGKPLDLTRRFDPDEDFETLRHFFDTAGYLHLRG